MAERAERRFAVIGAGFFGCEIASRLARGGTSVALLEKADRPLTRASYANQARIHGGYHYPRSVLTASRSRANYHRFIKDYREAVWPDFEPYYAVASENSKVTADQFRLFMERVGAPLTEPPAWVKDLFNPDLIEAVFAVDEAVFDAARLRQLVLDRLPASVDLRLGTAANRIRPLDDGRLLVEMADGSEVAADQVFVCLYSQTNVLLEASGLPLIPLKHELAEMPLIDVPERFRRIGVTVMCGPFFSLMPFPDRAGHSLSHVRYTPHHEWHDVEGRPVIDAHRHLADYHFRSNFPQMSRDAGRYLPALADCRYRDESIWEVKTVLPQSETDDSRPILMRTDQGLTGLHCVLGAKIDNIYDILAEIDKMNL